MQLFVIGRKDAAASPKPPGRKVRLSAGKLEEDRDG
jgi:hypothetical protein